MITRDVTARKPRNNGPQTGHIDTLKKIKTISNMMAIPRVWLAEFVILFPKLKMISVFSMVKIKKNARSQTNIPPLRKSMENSVLDRTTMLM